MVAHRAPGARPMLYGERSAASVGESPFDRVAVALNQSTQNGKVGLGLFLSRGEP